MKSLSRGASSTLRDSVVWSSSINPLEQGGGAGGCGFMPWPVHTRREGSKAEALGEPGLSAGLLCCSIRMNPGYR